MALIGCDAVDPPGSGHAFELVFAFVNEFDVGARDQIRDGARDVHISRPSEARDPLADHDCDTFDVIASLFDLAGV